MAFKKTKKLIPFLILFSLLGVLWHELFSANPHELPSPLIGETIPSFTLPDLNHSGATLSPNDLKGHVTLLNVWATWCYACNLEHEMLMKISKTYRVPIYSINYKDNTTAAKQWLVEKGNPYTKIGDDSKGDVAIDLGVYGTPETFIISTAGKIVYRHVGTITQESWNTVLYPIIKKYEGISDE